MFLFKNKRLRRYLGVALVVTGGLLMWFAPEVGVGVFVLAAGIVIEVIGIWLERERPP
jgi:hypothetical protein